MYYFTYVLCKGVKLYHVCHELLGNDGVQLCSWSKPCVVSFVALGIVGGEIGLLGLE